MHQKRLLIALILSAAILFAWSFLFPPTQTPNPAATPSPSPNATAPQQAAGSSTPAAPAPVAMANVNTAPQRTITIKTPLYDAKFDTLGAEPISWILKKNKHSGAPIYSVAGRKSDRIPLELISPEGLKRQPRLVPLQLHTGDPALDVVLSSSTCNDK